MARIPRSQVRRLGALASIVTALLSVDCIPPDPNATGTCTIPGTYAESDTRDPNNPGDCPADPTNGTTSTLTVTVNGSDAEIAFPLLSGTCPTTVNGCNVTGSCTMKDGSGTNVATFQIAWTFSETGFSGTTAIGSLVKGCQENVQTTGTRH